MDTRLSDLKLKNLIRLCKATKNYKKLAVVGLILISNKVDEISTKLGIRARKKAENEHLFKYLEFINRLFYEMVKINIVPEEVIERLKVIELLFMKLRGDIPYDHIKELYEMYYELRKIDVPNVYKSFELEDAHHDSDLNLFSYLSGKGKRKNTRHDQIKQLLMHQITQKEINVRRTMDESFDKESFEKALYLKRLRSSLSSKTKNIIPSTGKLNSNIYYQITQQSSLKYLLLGGIVVFILLLGVIIYESVIFTHLTSVLSLYLITFLGITLVLFLVYHKYFRGGER